MKVIGRMGAAAVAMAHAGIVAVALMAPAQAQLTTLAQNKNMAEAWEFALDGREWTLGNAGSYHEHVRREYVLKGEDAENFSEKIITARYPKAPAESIEMYMAGVKAASVECEGTKLTVIEQDDNAVIYERNVKKRCEGAPLQTQIVKMVFKNGGAVSFSYVKKVPELGTIAHNQWIELVKFATPK